jgi:uncharacterized protein YqcC (DUF446 family)
VRRKKGRTVNARIKAGIAALVAMIAALAWWKKTQPEEEELAQEDEV